MILNKRVDKQTLIYTHKRLLLSNKDTKIPIHTNNIAYSQNSELKKTSTNECTLYNFIYMEF